MVLQLMLAMIGRGIMKSYANMVELAKEYILLENIETTFQEHNMLANKQTKNPESGP